MPSKYRWLVLVPIAALYAASLPRTVQGLDTGDLVASGLKLWVPHPPGYPLDVWLLHFFCELVPWGTPFARAAALTAVFMLAGLAVLLAMAETWAGTLLVLVTATAPVIWKYAVLPDVFALHVFLSSVIVYECSRPQARPFVACTAFALAAANHQTVVFLAPALLLLLVAEPSWRRRLLALFTGAFLCIGLYGSLLLLDTAAVESWGYLRSFSDVLHHVLRADYGTFRLSGQAVNAPIDTIVGGFVAAAWPLVCVALVAAIAYLRRIGVERLDAQTRAWLVVSGCLLVYLLAFLPLMNLPAGEEYEGTRERFYIFPIVIMTAIAVRAFAALPLQRTVALVVYGGLGLLVAANVTRSLPLLDLACDTVVEDYARNLLDTAATGRPAFLLLTGDTKWFGVRYVQAVEGSRDVITVGLGRAFSPELLEKLHTLRPVFQADVSPGLDASERSGIERFVVPNVDKFDFTHTLAYTSPLLRTIVYPLGKRVERGSGIGFAEAPRPLTIRPPVYELEKDGYVETVALYNEYSAYYLARGRDAASRGDSSAAIRDFRAGLAIVPWCVPCLESACTLERTAGQWDASCNDAQR